MANIFISYDRASKPSVLKLVNDLDGLGHPVWFDDDLSGGQDWWNHILEQIRSCEVFLFALTPRSLKSVACTREYEYAHALGKPIVPILLAKGVDLDLLPEALSRIHHVNFLNPKDKKTTLAVGKSINTVSPAKSLPDELPTPPDLPVSYLADLAKQARAVGLSDDEQSSLLEDIEASLDDSAPVKKMREILQDFKQRDDLSPKIIIEVDALLLRIKKVHNRLTAIMLVLVVGLGSGVLSACRYYSDPGIPLPEMVEIPGGTFIMGSNSGGEENEYPEQEVSIQPFRLSRTEVTFEHYDAYVQSKFIAGELAYSPEDSEWGRGNRPVINVSWDDVQGYITWLNEQTSGGYRLPNEAEWEYAAKPGTDTDCGKGDEFGDDQANCGVNGSKMGEVQSAPVANSEPNLFGLYDMNGNVYEWMQDCIATNFVFPPNFGNSNEGSDCGHRAVRGGSMFFFPPFGAPVSGINLGATNRSNYVGFRLAQDL